MSRAADKDLAASMGRRRPKEAIREEVADSVLAELVPPSTIDIPLEALYRSPFQVREQGTEDDINQLAESLVASGLISPIVVRIIANPDPELRFKPLPEFLANAEKDLTVKSFELITGHHRVLAAMQLGWSVIPAVVKHMSDQQAAIALTADNLIKRDLTDWDRYQSMLMLERTGACRTGRELAATLGISAAQVSQMRAFGKLPSAAQDLIATNRAAIGYRLAYELESLELNAQQPDLVTEAIARLIDGKIKTQGQVVTWIHTQLATRAPRAYRRELRVQRPGSTPIRLVFTPEGATIAAAGLDPERLAKLIEENLTDLLM